MAAKPRGLPEQLHPKLYPPLAKMKTTFILPLNARSHPEESIICNRLLIGFILTTKSLLSRLIHERGRKMAVLDGFALDADITLSELRQEDVLDARLRTFHRLRLRRRNELVGVVVDAESWRQIEAYVRQLEERIEHLEDATARAVITSRAPDATFVELTASDIADIDREYQALVRGD